MKKALSIAYVLLLLFCACQPSPTEDAIVNRVDGALEKAVRTNPVEPYVYQAPSRWEEKYSVREQEILFSADIVIPNTKEHPVTTIKQRAFSSSDIGMSRGVEYSRK